MAYLQKSCMHFIFRAHFQKLSISNNSQIHLRICRRIHGFFRTYDHQLQLHYKYSIIMMKMCFCVCARLMHSYLKWKRITNTRSMKGNYPWLGDNTSSISLVFDFSKESTLEWRLLTVLLKLIKKKLIQNHTNSQRQEKVCYPGLIMLTDMPQLPCLNF